MDADLLRGMKAQVIATIVIFTLLVAALYALGAFTQPWEECPDGFVEVEKTSTSITCDNPRWMRH